MAKGLSQLHDRMARHVERGDMPGLITFVAHEGEEHVDVIGKKDFNDREPMQRDAIFRIASLTKPITAAAAMILVDEGTLQLDGSVNVLLPELNGQRVLRTLDAHLDDTVPARRPITLNDLLTYQLGFGVIMEPPDTYPIQTAEVALQLMTLGPPWPPTPHTPDEWIRHFGSLPLMHQPGDVWMYNTGSQVLGILIERAAGQPLETFLRERLLEPLGMRDTAFSFTEAQRSRMTTAYAPDPVTGELQVLDGVEDSYWSRPPALPNAAGWLDHR
jgi:CubicO group peptidase (beta-lactamase class C family)